VDDIDRLLLSRLAVEGRITMAELGEAVGLSSSAAHRRVKALEAAGVVRGYRAELDAAALGRGFEVYVSVTMRSTDPDTIAAFEAALDGVPSVIGCHRLFGEPDYLLLVAVRDVAAYEQLWSTALSTLPGTARVASQMTMKRLH
jgi:Lrp/AsnC family transcriptional regulator, leucine-responsive regulatory protein